MRTSSFRHPQSCSFLAWCLFLLSIIGNSFGSSICNEKERQVLLSFKHNISDPNNLLSSWTDGDDDCCKWEGVGCDNRTGHVVAVDLGPNTMCINEASCTPDWDCDINPALQGEIGPSLLDLPFPNYLDLSCNQFERISRFIGSLGKLVHLNLSYNNFVGNVPPQLGNISTLKYLDINNNNDGELKVVGTLEWVSHLDCLEYLGLDFVDLSSASNWLESISKLSLLRTLHLSYFYCPDPSSLLHLNSSRFLQHLFLKEGNLTSPILNLWLNQSSDMIQLSLTRTELYGVVPNVLNKMHSLEYLDLSFNYLEGKKTEDLQFLSHLTNLKTLDLSENSFSFNFSELIIGSEKMIEELKLWRNKIVGSLNDIKKYCSIRTLHLSENELSGSLPDMSTMLSMKLLFISNSRLVGNLMGNVSSNFLEETIDETQFSNFSKLRFLSLSGNRFKLNFSTQWIPPFQLSGISLSSCNLGPKFPKWLQTQANLEFLDISNNGISDFIPHWISNFTYVQGLNISQNFLQGFLPNLYRSTHFVIDFSNNRLEGHVPRNYSGTIFLGLSENMLSGTISFLCTDQFKRARYLDLSNNHFSGNIPECLGQYAGNHLSSVNLANNKFSGEIPSSISYLNQMYSLHLRNNSLFGELPLSLKNCTSLRILDLGENQLSGVIPEWIGKSLIELKVLYLHSNELNGSIPLSICQLQSIRILDLSLNNLSGSIPTCFSNYSAAMSKISDEWFLINAKFGYTTFYGIYALVNIHFDYELVMWKGKEVQYGKNLRFLKVIDLSGNKLVGKFPVDLTNLYGLNSLNLSRNYLFGSIPSEIGQMRLLENLDLSNNQLSGAIPVSMADLSFLAYLNLSNNNFSGCIPLGTQLQSFTEANYQGNPKLRGPPLPTKCQRDEHGNAPHSEGIEETKEDENWIVRNFGFFGVKAKYGNNILALLKLIDLSANQLTGQIPIRTGFVEPIKKPFQWESTTVWTTHPEDKILQRSPGTQGNNKHDHWKENMGKGPSTVSNFPQSIQEYPHLIHSLQDPKFSMKCNSSKIWATPQISQCSLNAVMKSDSNSPGMKGFLQTSYYLLGLAPQGHYQHIAPSIQEYSQKRDCRKGQEPKTSSDKLKENKLLDKSRIFMNDKVRFPPSIYKYSRDLEEFRLTSDWRLLGTVQEDRCRVLNNGNFVIDSSQSKV
nr:receptor-like protein 12 [Ipomoea batatas]